MALWERSGRLLFSFPPFAFFSSELQVAQFWAHPSIISIYIYTLKEVVLQALERANPVLWRRSQAFGRPEGRVRRMSRRVPAFKMREAAEEGRRLQKEAEEKSAAAAAAINAAKVAEAKLKRQHEHQRLLREQGGDRKKREEIPCW